MIDAISISLWESVVLSNSAPPILISQIPHSKLKRSRQLQGNPMEIWKRQKITFDRGIPQTTFSMNSKDLDYRLTPLAVDITMEGGRGFTHWSNSVNEVPISEFGRFPEIFMHGNPDTSHGRQRINQPSSNGRHREIVRRYGQHPEGTRGFV